MTLPSNNPGTIDLTNVVSNLKTTFVSWATSYLVGAETAIPGFEWLAVPVIEEVDKIVTEKILTALVNSVVMEAFFLNTVIRKSSQAQDYIDAMVVKNALPVTATEEEYKNAEASEMSTFRNFVVLSN